MSDLDPRTRRVRVRYQDDAVEPFIIETMDDHGNILDQWTRDNQRAQLGVAENIRREIQTTIGTMVTYRAVDRTGFPLFSQKGFTHLSQMPYDILTIMEDTPKAVHVTIEIDLPEVIQA